MEYIRDHIHAKTLFATHYHELTDLESEHIKNYCVAVKERGAKVVFLRRIVAGSADKSYGIHVARLAGLPNSVTQRAQAILDALEAEKEGAACLIAREEALAPQKAPMTSLFDTSLSTAILSLDVMTMTPL